MGSKNSHQNAPVSNSWRQNRSKQAKRAGFVRRLAIESLEQRLLLANIGINLRVDIQQFIPNAYTDPLNGDGDFYAIVDSVRGGPIMDTSNNPLTGPQNFGIGEQAPSPWSGNVSYSISDEALLYGSLGQRRDLLHVSIFDYDDTSNDDEIDINPFVDSSNQPINGRVTLDLDLRSGLVRSPYSNPYSNGVRSSPAYESYYFRQAKRENTATGLEVVSYIELVGAGNESRYDSNSVNQIAGGKTFIRLQVRYFDFDGTGPAPIDSDGDGLFDIQEGTAPAPEHRIPGSDPNRADVFVTVDAMNGLAPLPLPGIVNASNTSPIVIESPHHGLSSGAIVTVSGIQGNTAANGTFYVQRLSNNTFSLHQFYVGTSAGNGVYTGGGVWSVNVPNPTGTSLDLVVDAFARAPIINSSGPSGIKLHLDLGALNLGRDDWTDGPTDIGGLSHYAAALEQRKLRPGFVDGISRYAIFADKIVEKRGTGANADLSGTIVGAIGRSYGSEGFAVTMGAFQTQFVDDQAAVFMHFLGQSLGLESVDGVLQDFNPNHPSVMNSLWAIPLPGTYDAKNWRLDYSLGTKPDVDENGLVESAGLGGSVDGRVAIGPVVNVNSKLQSVASAGPVDLNENGKKTDVISRDINRFRSTDAASPTVLKDRNEWEKLEINLGTVGVDFSEKLTKGEFYRELSWEDVVAFEAASPAKISISDATTPEPFSTSQATFTVSLDIPLHTTISVPWSVVLGGTASANDVNTPTGTLTFLPGQTRGTITVGIKSDSLMERDETFTVLLSNPTGNVVLYDNFGLGTIVDDDVQAVYASQSGPLDITFDSDGAVITDLPDTVLNAFGTATADSMLDSNGRLVVFGSTALGGDIGVKAVRYLPNGILDPTFGTNGVVSFRLNGDNFRFIGGAVYQSSSDPNRDKLLLVGNRRVPGDGRIVSVIVRLNVDGTPDTSFGSDGNGWLTSPPVSDRTLVGVAIYNSGPDVGKFAVLQNDEYGGAAGFGGAASTVLRYLEGGQVDTTFGNDGQFAFRFNYPDGVSPTETDYTPTVMTEILIDGNGKILLAGYAGQPGTYSSSGRLRSTTGAIARLKPNGGLDDAFGSPFGSWEKISGATFTGLNPPTFSGGAGPQITDIALQSDGKIVASVYGGVNGSGRLVRFDRTGLIEFVSPPNENVKGASAVAVDNQGRVYIGGYTLSTNSERFGVARYLPSDGSLVLDLNFDPFQHDGVLSTAIYGEYNSLQIDTDGRLFASGTTFIIRDTGPYNGSAVYTVNKFVPERDDLSISITANTSQVLVDGSITYTIEVNNTGDEAIFPAIQNIIPTGAVFESLSVPSGWIFSAPEEVDQTGKVIASRRSMKQSDGPQTFILQLRLVESQPIETLTNTLTVSSETSDYNAANNSASVSSSISLDHSVSVGASTLGLLAAGDLVTFPITVENRSVGRAMHVLTAVVPDDSVFVSASGSPSYNSQTRTITWPPSEIEPGFNHVRQVVLRSTIAGYLQLTAQVKGFGSLLDLTPLNNSSSSPIDALLLDSSGLLSLLKAEGNLDDQTGTHTGLPSSIISYAEGRLAQGQGQAFAFNGSNTSVDLGNWFNLQSFTIGMWIRPGDSQVEYADILDNNHGPNWVVQYQNQVVNGKQRFAWAPFDGAPIGIPIDLTPSVWQYLSITRDKDTKISRVYIDGQLQGSTTGTGNISYSNQYLRLGRWGGGGRNFNGLMDDISIFDRPLSQTEVQKAMNGILFPNQSFPNQNPTIIATSNVVNVVQDQLATLQGTINDANNASNSLLVYASVGQVVVHDAPPIGPAIAGPSRNWTWTYDTDASTPTTGPVTIYVNDGFGGISSTTFTVVVNRAPTAITLTPLSISLQENSDTSSAITLSAIQVTDDGVGTNFLSLSGPDSSSFEIFNNNQLRLKAGVGLDFEMKSSYSVRVDVDDPTVGATPDASANFMLNVTDVGEVTKAYLFYNNSGFETPINTNAGMLAALVDPERELSHPTTEKAILILRSSSLGTQTTTFANVSSYTRGITGLVFDVNGLGTNNLLASDFIFRRPKNLVSGTVNPSLWTGVVPEPTSIIVVSGSPTRIRIEWADNAIKNTWLQVIVKKNANTGLVSPVVFYIGNAAGEINGEAPYRIGVPEISAVQAAISSNPVAINNILDVDKNRRVGVTDLSYVQGNANATILLDNIIIPAAGSDEEGANPPPMPPPTAPLILRGAMFTRDGSSIQSTANFGVPTFNLRRLQVSKNTDAAIAELYSKDPVKTASTTDTASVAKSAQSLDDFFAGVSGKNLSAFR